MKYWEMKLFWNKQKEIVTKVISELEQLKTNTENIPTSSWIGKLRYYFIGEMDDEQAESVDDILERLYSLRNAIDEKCKEAYY